MCFVAITKLRVKTRAAVWTFRSMLNRGQRREFEQKAAKETKVNQGLGLCHGHPVGPSAFLQSSSRLKWCGRMRRPMPVCLPIGLVFLRRGCEPLPSMLNRRQRREFEQKAAKETKVNQGLGLCHGHPVGPSASLQSSSRLKWCNRLRRPMSVCLPIGLVFLRRGCEPLPSMLN